MEIFNIDKKLVKLVSPPGQNYSRVVFEQRVIKTVDNSELPRTRFGKFNLIKEIVDEYRS